MIIGCSATKFSEFFFEGYPEALFEDSLLAADIHLKQNERKFWRE